MSTPAVFTRNDRMAIDAALAHVNEMHGAIMGESAVRRQAIQLLHDEAATRLEQLQGMVVLTRQTAETLATTTGLAIEARSEATRASKAASAAEAAAGEAKRIALRALAIAKRRRIVGVFTLLLTAGGGFGAGFIAGQISDTQTPPRHAIDARP